MQRDHLVILSSLFQTVSIPGASIQDLCVVGIEPFEGDTLIYIESFDVAVHVISAIKMENIEVKDSHQPAFCAGACVGKWASQLGYSQRNYRRA